MQEKSTAIVNRLKDALAGKTNESFNALLGELESTSNDKFNPNQELAKQAFKEFNDYQERLYLGLENDDTNTSKARKFLGQMQNDEFQIVLNRLKINGTGMNEEEKLNAVMGEGYLNVRNAINYVEENYIIEEKASKNKFKKPVAEATETTVEIQQIDMFEAESNLLSRMKLRNQEKSIENEAAGKITPPGRSVDIGKQSEANILASQEARAQEKSQEKNERLSA